MGRTNVVNSVVYKEGEFAVRLFCHLRGGVFFITWASHHGLRRHCPCPKEGWVQGRFCSSWHIIQESSVNSTWFPWTTFSQISKFPKKNLIQQTPKSLLPIRSTYSSSKIGAHMTTRKMIPLRPTLSLRFAEKKSLCFCCVSISYYVYLQQDLSIMHYSFFNFHDYFPMFSFVWRWAGLVIKPW
jgi:hypothetical protein